MTRALLIAALASLTVAAPASALPGDPLPEPLTPAEGATVAPDPDGIGVTFTCPLYRSSPSDDAPTTDSQGYIVRFSRTPGSFEQASTDSSLQETSPERCAGKLDDSDRSQTVPGRVYWRVDRSCFCPNDADSESGPVSSFVIRAPKPKLATLVQKRAYAGYAFTAQLRASADVLNGTEARLEHQVGGGWKPVGDATDVIDGRASADVSLPRGRQLVRWTIIRGDQRDSAAPKAVGVVKATDWSTDASDDGRYAARNIGFRVDREGREIRDFKTTMTVFCIGPLVENNSFVVSTAFVPRARIAPDGRFLTTVTVSDNDMTLRGRLRAGRVTGGEIELAYSTCSGARDFTARQRGPG